MTKTHFPAYDASMQAAFTSGDAQRLVGVSLRRLVYWDHTALVRPHARPASGRGSRRLYTAADVVKLKIIRRLLEAGLSLQKIRAALDFLATLADEPAPLAELEILTDGRRILVRKSDENLIDPLVRHYVLRFPVADLLAEVESGSAPTPFAELRKTHALTAFGVGST